MSVARALALLYALEVALWILVWSALARAHARRATKGRRLLVAADLSMVAAAIGGPVLLELVELARSHSVAVGFLGPLAVRGHEAISILFAATAGLLLLLHRWPVSRVRAWLCAGFGTAVMASFLFPLALAALESSRRDQAHDLSAPMPPVESALPSPSPAGTTPQVRDVFFAFDSLELPVAAKQDLDALAARLHADPGLRVRLEGSTDDNGGDRERALQVSQARADAVKKYLTQNGVEPSRVDTIGLGLEKIWAPNDSEAGRAQNRRVHVILEEASAP